MTLPVAKQAVLMKSDSQSRHMVNTVFGNKQYLGSLSLDQLFHTHRPSVFFLRQKGQAADNLGIFAGDLLVVDRKLIPQHQQLIVVAVSGELRLGVYKRYANGKQQFFYGNKQRFCLSIDDNLSAVLWGVVIGTVRSY